MIDCPGGTRGVDPFWLVLRIGSHAAKPFPQASASVPAEMILEQRASSGVGIELAILISLLL